MVSLYFGLPGSGKSSLLTFMAIREQNKILIGKSRYSRVVSNVEIDYPGIIFMEFADMLKYDLGASTLILIDEGTLEFDSRDYKAFDILKKDMFLQHRRYQYDIIIFTQQWDGVDKKIRVITDRVYYVHTGGLLKQLSYTNRIPYGILIPKARDTDSKSYGEIVQGYHRGSFFSRLFCFRFYRPLVYGYYNSYIRPKNKLPLKTYLRTHKNALYETRYGDHDADQSDEPDEEPTEGA